MTAAAAPSRARKSAFDARKSAFDARKSAFDARRAALAALAFSGGFVFVEPSPYEVAFLLALGVFAAFGLRVHRGLAPLAAALGLYVAGGLASLVAWTDDGDSLRFASITVYVAATCMFWAAAVLEDPAERLAIVRRAYVAAAIVTGIAGILGFFGVAGLGELFSRYGRAKGFFKDMNVFGPFLAPALVWKAQDLALGRGRPRDVPVVAILAFALFLSFSRGAWGSTALSFALLIGLTATTAPDAASRRRALLLAFGAAAAVVVLLAIALAVPPIRDMLAQRAELVQNYDAGATGRFGGQVRSIPKLLLLPFGFGPHRFHAFMFGEDPHEVFLNAFASDGWLGGAAYLALVVSTVVVGARSVLREGPLRNEAVGLFACLFPQLAQGFQIDTDHWRHLLMLIGLTWGVACHGAARRGTKPAR